MARMYFGKTLMSPHTVDEKEVAKTKFGASIDAVIGDVDENGVLQKPTATTALNFAGIREIGEDALYYAFYENTSIISVDLSSLESVGNFGMYYAFHGCEGITGALDLSSLQTVGSGGMNSAFRICQGVTSVDLSSLQSVGRGGLSSVFRSCTGITKISFPSLTSVQNDSLSYAFNSCTNLTEIHFRADMQATIEAMSQYSSKWGATNATIHFDL